MLAHSIRPEFLNALFGEDDLGVVVRTHLHIESAVNALLDILIPIPKELPRLRYEQKLKLCCSMGMDKTLFQPLKELGDLRNLFAHNIDTKLTQGYLDRLLASVSPNDKVSISTSYETTRAATDENLPKSFTNLEPKGQLIGFATWLNATLDILQEDARCRSKSNVPNSN